jgi:hypothetical protein
LSVYLKQISRSKKNAKEDGLSEVEKLLMLILEKESIKSATIAIA